MTSAANDCFWNEVERGAWSSWARGSRLSRVPEGLQREPLDEAREEESEEQEQEQESWRVSALPNRRSWI